MKISSVFINKFNSVISGLASKSTKTKDLLNEANGVVDFSARDIVSVYKTKGCLYPDYDKVSIDFAKKGWQRKLKFNDKNTNPMFNEYALGKESDFNFLIPKKDLKTSDDVYFQTNISTPMKIENNPDAGVMIDNFSKPGGTISIEGNLSDTFYTHGLYQCAGVTIVDRAKNLQKLLHYFLFSDEGDSINLIKFLTRGLKNPEVTFIPGAREETNKSLNFLTQVFKAYLPDCKIKHLHVPEDFKVKDTYIGLKNGEVFCTPKNQTLISETNPEKKIVYI